jgi:hypothetical protein
MTDDHDNVIRFPHYARRVDDLDAELAKLEALLGTSRASTSLMAISQSGSRRRRRGPTRWRNMTASRPKPASIRGGST